MNILQRILKVITFGAYNPEKAFEQEVLGKVTTNLENVEALRRDVEEAVSLFDKCFPNDNNILNNYQIYYYNDAPIGKDENGCIYKNTTPVRVVESERKLQEQGKYLGMDEATRIKAVLSEMNATTAKESLIHCAKNAGQNIGDDVAEAYRISAYQKFMDIGYNDKEGFRDFFDNTNGDSDIMMLLKAVLHQPELWISLGKSIYYSFSEGGIDDIINKADAEGFISLIMANEKSIRQSDGTYLTKTSEEWEAIDQEREQELRDMPQELLISQGEALKKSLEERYDELTSNQDLGTR